MKTLKTEIIKTLFNEEVIKNAIQQRNSSYSSFRLDLKDVVYFLRLSSLGNVNLEIEMQNDAGLYNKTIGFYSFNNSGELEYIYVLKGFENIYEEIKGEINLNLTSRVRYLSLEENGYISVCSKEVLNKVKEMFNSPKYSSTNHLSMNNFQVEDIKVNGFNVQVRTSMMGALEANVNEDDEELDDVLVMFQRNGQSISVHCLEDTYDRLNEMKLLSVFN